MNILKDLLSESRIKTISVIAQTIWWSKDNALKKIFGTFNDPNKKLNITQGRFLINKFLVPGVHTKN